MAYELNLKDSNNNVVTILKSNSQIEMDKFTSFFTDENQLLKNLSLDESKFKVIVQKREKGNVIPMRFISKRNRNTVYLKNVNNIKKLVDIASTCDRDLIHTFFLNELLNLETKEETSFYNDKRKKILEIDKLLDIDEKNRKINDDIKNINDTQLFKAIMNSLFYRVELYGYSKSDYSFIKRLYLFLDDFKTKVGYDFETGDKEKEQKEGQEIFTKIKTDLENVLNKETNTFNVATRETNKILYNFEDNIEDFLPKTTDNPDTLHTELEMLMDKAKFDEEEKHEKLKGLNF